MHIKNILCTWFVVKMYSCINSIWNSSLFTLLFLLYKWFHAITYLIQCISATVCIYGVCRSPFLWLFSFFRIFFAWFFFPFHTTILIPRFNLKRNESILLYFESIDILNKNEVKGDPNFRTGFYHQMMYWLDIPGIAKHFRFRNSRNNKCYDF